MTRFRTKSLIAASAVVAPLLVPLPAAANMILSSTGSVLLQGCDAPTPVRAPSGAIYSNVSDCSISGGKRVSTGWVQVSPSVRFIQSNLTTYGNGASGRKLSSAVVEGGTVYVLQRNLTKSGGMRLGWSSNFSQSSPKWRWASWTMNEFGWGSFAQASNDNYQYVYLRGSKTAYGKADHMYLARVRKGRVENLSQWEVFAGTPQSPAWVPWAKRSARKPVLTDSGKIHRPHVSYLNGCWTMAVTMPPPRRVRGGNGLAVYTSKNAYGPWNRRYYVSGVNLGESAQFSPLYRGKLLLTRADRFEWRAYSMASGC